MGDNYKSNESFYSGGFSSFNPMYGSNSNFTGFKMNASTLSSNTNPGVANQIKEVIARLKEGVHNVEIGTIDPQMFESIPKQHFEEIKALVKLSGAETSLHAPINGMDPAGADNSGFSEEQRASTERRLFEAMRAAKTLSPDKGINVVIHSAVNGQPGQGYGAMYKPGGEGEDRFKISQVGIVERDTGRYLGQLKEEQDYKFDNPEDFKDKGTKINPLERLKEHNSQQWKQSLFDINNTRQQMDIEVARGAGDQGVLASIYERAKNGEEINKDKLNDEEKSALQSIEKSQIFLDMAKKKFDDAFSKAYKYGDDTQKNKLRNLAENFKNNVGQPEGKNEWLYRDSYKRELDKSILELEDVTKDRAPITLVSAEEYARDKSSETFGNLAWKSFNELGKGDANKTPVIAVENLYIGNTNATADSLKEIIEKSRSKFVEKAIKNGMDKDDAKKAAEKIIGVTWDVGHLNMFKREGFTDEDLVKQTEKISKYVKHVHLTDNFGYADTHLAPGMGNVPFKKILEELEKNNKFGEMKKIIEAGGLIANQLSNSQFKPALESFGAQAYATGGGYWNQATGVAAGGGYFGGQGEILPDKHFSIYGSGFSSLPISMGGQMPGTASRATGTPMA